MAEAMHSQENTDQQYENAAHEVTAVIREHSKTFFFATMLLPRQERLAIRALYGFCRASDDLVDCETTSPEDFAAWKMQVNRPANEQRSPMLLAWAHVRQAYPINRQYEQDLLAGMQMDLQFQPYPTWEALRLYCYRVASTVGLLSIPIIGLAPGVTFEQAARPAALLGIALQLTNILRDVGEDLSRGRVYLPLDDLSRFRLSLSDLQNRTYDERFIALMRFEIARARQLYRQSLPGIALLARRVRPAVAAAALLYARILDEIEALRYQVYTHRAHTKGWQKIYMLPQILQTVLRLNKLESPNAGLANN